MPHFGETPRLSGLKGDDILISLAKIRIISDHRAHDKSIHIECGPDNPRGEFIRLYAGIEAHIAFLAAVKAATAELGRTTGPLRKFSTDIKQNLTSRLTQDGEYPSDPNQPPRIYQCFTIKDHKSKASSPAPSDLQNAYLAITSLSIYLNPPWHVHPRLQSIFERLSLFSLISLQYDDESTTLTMAFKGFSGNVEMRQIGFVKLADECVVDILRSLEGLIRGSSTEDLDHRWFELIKDQGISLQLSEKFKEYLDQTPQIKPVPAGHQFEIADDTQPDAIKQAALAFELAFKAHAAVTGADIKALTEVFEVSWADDKYLALHKFADSLKNPVAKYVAKEQSSGDLVIRLLPAKYSANALAAFARAVDQCGIFHTVCLAGVQLSHFETDSIKREILRSSLSLLLSQTSRKETRSAAIPVKRLDLTDCCITDANTIEAIADGLAPGQTSLEFLILDHNNLGKAEFWSPLFTCLRAFSKNGGNELKGLQMASCQLGDEALAAMVLTATKSPFLQILDIGENIGVVSGADLEDCLSGLEHLKALRLRRTIRVGDGSPIIGSSLLESAIRLRSLHLDQTLLDRKDVSSICDLLQSPSGSKLEVLSLVRCGLAGDDLARIYATLADPFRGGFKARKMYLMIGGNRIAQGHLHLVEQISQLEGPGWLSLAGTSFNSEDAFIDLVVALKSNTSIRHLDLSKIYLPNGQATEKLCGALADLLRFNSTLQSLVLAGDEAEGGLIDDGARYGEHLGLILAHLSENKTIKYIDVRNNHIGDMGCLALLDYFDQSRKERQAMSSQTGIFQYGIMGVEIDGNNMSPAGFAKYADFAKAHTSHNLIIHFPVPWRDLDRAKQELRNAMKSDSAFMRGHRGSGSIAGGGLLAGAVQTAALVMRTSASNGSATWDDKNASAIREQVVREKKRKLLEELLIKLHTWPQDMERWVEGNRIWRETAMVVHAKPVLNVKTNMKAKEERRAERERRKSEAQVEEDEERESSSVFEEEGKQSPSSEEQSSSSDVQSSSSQKQSSTFEDTSSQGPVQTGEYAESMMASPPDMIRHVSLPAPPKPTRRLPDVPPPSASEGTLDNSAAKTPMPSNVTAPRAEQGGQAPPLPPKPAELVNGLGGYNGRPLLEGALSVTEHDDMPPPSGPRIPSKASGSPMITRRDTIYWNEAVAMAMPTPAFSRSVTAEQGIGIGLHQSPVQMQMPLPMPMPMPMPYQHTSSMSVSSVQHQMLSPTEQQRLSPPEENYARRRASSMYNVESPERSSLERTITMRTTRSHHDEPSTDASIYPPIGYK